MSGLKGLLYSQIGYDLYDPKKALIRRSEIDKKLEGAVFHIIRYNDGQSVKSAVLEYWGECWKSHWWIADFSSVNEDGKFILTVEKDDNLICQSGEIELRENLLWNQTIETVAIKQMEERLLVARNQTGWKDCGSDWREANSHASAIIGLSDLVNLGYEYLPAEDVERIKVQMIHGCDYLGICQDKSRSIGNQEGSVIHEIPNHMVIIPGDNLQAIIAWMRTSRLITETHPDKSKDFLNRAIKTWTYLKKDGKPFGGEKFSTYNHGAPEEYKVPDEYMTRDLLQFLWAAIELIMSGYKEYEEDVFSIAQEIMNRQVSQEEAEDGIYGHFYTFTDRMFTEKANIHHHVGHDTGGTFPFYILPFFEMINRWWNHKDLPKWKQTIENFARGFFLPACSRNPFNLIPSGFYRNEGLLTFCGPWHGVNGTLCLGAVLATKLESFTGDPIYREIAVGNIQWVAGLNAGLSKENFNGFHLWKENIPENVVLPFCQIDGIGKRHIKSWSGIKGSIVNGFSSNPQFELTVIPSKENDLPKYYTDEDWIPHGAAWVSALAHLRQIKFFKD